MDRLREFLDVIVEKGLARGQLLGFLHILIGRKVTLEDGTVVSSGQTWREAAALLKKARWEREAVAELGLNAALLPPRDRGLFWYKAISLARISSPEAAAAGDRLAAALKHHGYVVGKAPHG